MGKGYAAWAARWRVPLGFALGIAFVILARPTFALLLAGVGIALAGLWVRALAAGYLEKGKALAISGPYRYTRNPLYLGSLLLGSGFSIASASWWLGLAFLIFYLSIYGPVMRREEDSLRLQFAGIYEEYARAVPLFLPTFHSHSKNLNVPSSGESFRWVRYRKNREYEAAIGFVIGLVYLVVRLQTNY